MNVGLFGDVFEKLDGKEPITEYFIFSRWKDNAGLCEVNKFLSNATLSRVDKYVDWLNKTDVHATYKRENPAKYNKIVQEWDEE
jgi:hypothetical protein